MPGMIMDFKKCKLCKSKYLIIQGSKTHKKLTCNNCGKFQKFLSKQDVRDIEERCGVQLGTIKHAIKQGQQILLTKKDQLIIKE